MIRDKLKNPFIQQYVLELVLPFIGFYFFDWSLLIIAVFYLLDHIGSEFSFQRRCIKILRTTNSGITFPVLISLTAFLGLFVSEVYLVFSYFIDGNNLIEKNRALDELIQFVKEELWLLFPLVIWMYYLKDNWTFFGKRLHYTKNAKEFIRWHLVENLLILGLLSIGVVSIPTTIDPIILLISFALIKLIFDQTLMRWFDKKSDL